MKQTKIVATIGPSSMSVEILSEIINAGVNVCRLNFSHSEHPWHAECIANIREASKQTGKTIAILADLQGPRIRTFIREDIPLSIGDEALLVEKAIVEEGGDGIGIDQPHILEQLKEGKQILIEDGKIILESIQKENGNLRCKVTMGGVVKNHKGMNFPGAQLKLPVLTPKDEKDIRFSLEYDVDYIALSFVGRGEDIITLRNLMKQISPEKKQYPMIVPKIERQDAIENLDDIIREADAVMVARGDLGIEVEESRVVILQKEIIEKCLFQVKPVIVATQMLESMMENPRPTRAEVSDVSNAVIDHADATMLSGETAGGKYPVEVVKMMTDIIKNTEESPFDDVCDTLEMRLKSKYAFMVRGVYEFARSNNVDAILATSATGYTARLLSHFRPKTSIYIATENPITHRQLSLVWGVKSFLFEGESNEDVLIELLVQKLKQEGNIVSGNEVVTVFHATVKLQRVKEEKKS
ncbi:MAG: pyruvate kinase [Candidatus Moraniibacteriota bacterium]|nr:MAG: pyruvate kinase [Candidatus Moranbacteria bacterium]